MNRKEYNTFSDDLILLEKLKAEQSGNLKKCLKRINRRRTLVLSLSSVAAVLVASVLVWNFSADTVVKNDIVVDNTINKPTLILHSGEKIALGAKPSELPLFKHETNIEEEPMLNSVIIPSCFTHKVILEDGTEVFLNANSELKYPSSFGNQTREVYFKGEGYFKVTKSTKRFIVHTPDVSIKVYGTEFNVNTSRNKKMETLLVRGSVGLSSSMFSGGDIMMQPNELFCFDAGNSEITIVNPDDYLGWISGNFVCNSKPLSYLLNDIAMWYGVEFSIDKECVKKIVTVDISRELTIDALFETIEEMSGVKFMKEGRNGYSVK